MSEQIRACELMAAAFKEKEKYEGKMYMVIAGSLLHSRESQAAECVIHNGRLASKNCKSDYLAAYSDTMLSEIPQPVSLMDATKLFISGKTVICESKEFGKRKYTKKTKGARFEEEDGIPVSAYEILYGTWYAEE